MPAPARWSRWCWRNIARRISTTHVPKLTRGLRAKLDTLMEALNEQFGTAAEFEDPKGGIFLWVKLPDNVDTLKLYQAALAAGVAINPGAGMVDRQGLCRQPAAAVLRQPLARADPRGRRRARRSLPQGVRRAGAERQCGEARADIGRRVHGQRQVAGSSQRNASAIRSSRTIDTLPLPASIWAT